MSKKPVNFTTLGTTKQNSNMLKGFAEQNNLGSKTKALVLLVQFGTSAEGLKAFRMWRSRMIASGRL